MREHVKEYNFNYIQGTIIGDLIAKSDFFQATFGGRYFSVPQIDLLRSHT